AAGPEGEELPDLLEREIQLPQIGDQAELLQVRVGVEAPAPLADDRGLEQARLLVEADRAQGGPRLAREIPGAERGVGVLVRHVASSPDNPWRNKELTVARERVKRAAKGLGEAAEGHGRDRLLEGEPTG